MSALAEKIEAIIATSGTTSMGVALEHLESGESSYHNADELFPMASVLKIPVLCAAFRQIQAGAFTLADRWELTATMKNMGSGILTYLEAGLQPTVRDLLTVMMIISDNTATDMVMNRVGVANIDQFMKELGLINIHLKMTIRGIFADIYGPEKADPDWLFGDLTQPKTMPPARRDGHAYSGSPENNASSARDMTRLLTMIYRGAVVNRAASDSMLYIMLQQQLNARLPRYLPFGIPFAHKTGTLAGVRNDAGVLYVNRQNHVAITVYSRWDAAAVKDDKIAEWEQTERIDSAFGQIGKAIFDHYQ